MSNGILFLNRRELSIVMLIAVMTTVVTWMDPGFLSLINLRDIFVRCAPTAIVACGVMLVVVTGEIDISVGSLMALLAAVLGITLSRDYGHWPMLVGIPIVLLIGTAAGWMTGLLVTMGNVPSIMVTLGLMTALRGATTLVMQGKTIQGLPDDLSQIMKQGFWGLPFSIWTAGVVVLVTAWLVHRTALGRRLYAIGSSPHSALMAGLPTGRLKRFAFAYTGFLTALATIVDVPRLPQIESGIGNELELLVITCVVVGGVSISGGRARLIGVMLGVILMTLIRPLLTFMAIGESGEKWTKAIQGLLILIAVVTDQVLESSKRVEAHR